MNRAAARRDLDESAYLLFPRASLAECLVIAIVRDTRGKDLSPETRFNYYPRSPYCSLTWFLEGAAHHVRTEADMANPQDGPQYIEAFVSGPTSTPTVTWNPGPVLAMTLGFYPDSWTALTGMKIDPLVDRNIPAKDVLNSELLDIVSTAHGKSDLREGFDTLETMLEPIWKQQRRLGNGIAPLWLRGWAGALAIRAATSKAGKSTRQMQRRIRSWSGQSLRQLSGQARVEELFAKTREAGEDKPLDLAALAQDNGFSDQAHMGREVRRTTGFSPAKINELIATDERFWVYRLLGERYI